jgi:ribonuclease BN (tRNA processing enzyme)
MRVIFLGTGTLHPDPERGSCGILLQCAGESVPIDLGRGVLDEMAAAGVDPLALGEFHLTHLHPDHSQELVSLLFGLRHGRSKRRPVRVWGPPGLAELTERIQVAWPATRADYPLELRETEGGVLRDDVVRVEAIAVPHGSRPALGYRVAETATGTVVAFTGDSGPGPALRRLARDADLLIAECGYGLGPRRGKHLDVATLIDLVGTSGARRVAVTHLPPDGRAAASEALERGLADRLVLPRDGDAIDL